MRRTETKFNKNYSNSSACIGPARLPVRAQYYSRRWRIAGSSRCNQWRLQATSARIHIVHGERRLPCLAFALKPGARTVAA